MLYKFKSKATGDLIMLEPQGKQILQLIGKEPGAKGIILPIEMMAAIEALHVAVAQEEQAYQAAKEAANAGNTDEAESGSVNGPRGISLKQRVVPFIDMLRRAHAEDKEVVWGV
jgi:cyclopropane-fatty-acyl-phospholipid synthase